LALVATRQVKDLSVSQVESFRECPRKWFRISVLGQRQPQKPSAQLGTCVHTGAQRWHEEAIDPDGAEIFEYPDPNDATKTVRKFPGRILQSGLHLLPPPRTVLCEGNFRFRTPSGFWFRGARDGLTYVVSGPGDARRYYLPTKQLPRVPAGALGFFLLLDHKTTVHPIWAKSDLELLDDVQANVYALEIMNACRVEEVHCQWTYFLTDERPDAPKRYGADDTDYPKKLAKWHEWVAAGRPPAWKVEFIVTRTTAMKIVAEVERDAATMVELREVAPQTTWQEMTPNFGACSNFGGCPFGPRGLAECQRPITNVYGAKEMSLKSLVAAKQKELDAAAAPPPPPPEPDYWQPGDDLNSSQKIKQGLGKPLWVVALAADNPPDPEVAQSWPDALKPYVESLDHPAIKMRLANEERREAGLPPPPPETPVGVEERGTINPELPPPPPGADVDDAPPPPVLDKAALQARAKELGITPGRLGEAALRKKIAEAEASAGAESDSTDAPPPPAGDVDSAPTPEFDRAFARAVAVELVAILQRGIG
jgi:hypothetical protein